MCHRLLKSILSHNLICRVRVLVDKSVIARTRSREKRFGPEWVPFTQELVGSVYLGKRTEAFNTVQL